MYWIIGASSTKDSLRVIDTQDLVIDDITEKELREFRKSGVRFENLKLPRGVVQYSQYPIIGEKDVFTFISAEKNKCKCVSQNGVFIEATENELLNMCVTKKTTNLHMLDCSVPFGKISYIRELHPMGYLPGVRINANNMCYLSTSGRVFTIEDNMCKLYFNVDDKDYSVTMKMLKNRTKYFIYYAGFIHTDGLELLWDYLEFAKIGETPVLMVLLEYDTINKRFTNCDMVLNGDIEKVNKIRVVRKGKLIVPCIYKDEEVKRFSMSVDMIKHRLLLE